MADRLFHQSPQRFHAAIAQEGLKGRSESSTPGEPEDMHFPVYLTDSPKGATHAVNVKGLSLEHDEYDGDDPNEHWYGHYGTISPDRITRVFHDRR
jgi:hypothetical protein